MGGGGRMPSPTSLKNSDSDHLKRVPSDKPPFTFGELKKAIPPRCFHRSVLRSFSYVVYDLTLASIFYYIATTYFQNLPTLLYYPAWALYWVVQGSVLTGVWNIAHECGHHAFSDYQWLDDTVGLILHSALMVPYFSWKISHRRHHANIGSLERDEVYVPKQRSSVTWYFKYFDHQPGRVFTIAFRVLLGWPLYLAINAAGRPYDRLASHYDPYSPIYSDQERLQVFISDAGLLAVLYGLYRLVLAKGLAWVVCVYGVPLLFVNGFLIIITYLQHTHPALPHYDSSEWDWLRGALSTVDRDYGILNKFFHDVTITHVTHHLISTIPHYHAVEANKAIKPILGKYYRFDSTPICKALWREAKECVFVERDEGDKKGVYWFRNKL